MALVAALAVVFEVVPGLRGGLGNVTYFVIWITGMSLSAARSRGGPQELLGIRMLVDQMQAACKAAFPDYSLGSFAMGFNIKEHGVWNLETFVWEGARWTPEMLAWRAFWLATPIGLTLLAAPVFDRFDSQRAGLVGGRKRLRHAAPASVAGDEMLAAPPAPGPSPPSIAAASAAPVLPTARTHPAPAPGLHATARPVGRAEPSRLAALVAAELRIALHGVSRWWWVVALGLAVASLFAPLPVARQFLAPFTMVWPMLVWSPMGTRERRHGTEALLFSTPRPVVRLLLAQWLAGVLIAAAAASGALARFAIGGDPASLAALLAGIAFVPSLALSLGVWTGSAKAFEVIYMLLWYAGPMNRIPPIDFVGATQPDAGARAPITFVALAAALLALAVLGRGRQLRG
jgi:hypothetical protein